MTAPRSYKAICFDLDGTLLPMDIDEFMDAYFGSIYQYVAEHGLNAPQFMEGLKAGTKAMASHQDERTNAQAFWDEFFQHVDETAAPWQELLETYYETVFDGIGAEVKANPAVARSLQCLKEKGYPLVVATMPMFPLVAVQKRLGWAGVDPELFDRITHYENSRAIKPKPQYYAELLAALGLSGDDVLMVGNNTLEDLSFMKLGADGYLITDWLLDPVSLDLATVKHSSMEDFERWVQELPACTDPANTIQAGVVDADARQETFDALGVTAHGDAHSQAQALAAADFANAHGEEQ